RINKTLYLLNYIDDEDYRRRILTQLNRGESRHAVARAICHGQSCDPVSLLILKDRKRIKA
ncbi:Tn3 family transposase, partial [Escherichia coli]